MYSTKNELDIYRVTMETDGSEGDLFIDRLRLAKKNYSRDADAENGCDNCAPDSVVYGGGRMEEVAGVFPMTPAGSASRAVH
ncbi:MAG: hypothetical protein R2818_06895 [Flavobacteriales bacterium]